ncbi:uncharacterized protein LOC143236211 isoform X2 [Tachypleus tridentatus]
MRNTQMSQFTGFQFFLILLLSMKTATSDKSQTIQNEKEVTIGQWGHVDPPIITDFLCKCVQEGVYYADIKLKCKVFHTCTKSSAGHLILNSFRCSKGTAFRQELQICDFKDNVLCDSYPMPCTSSTTATATSSTSSSTTTKMPPVKVSVPKINKEYFKVQQQKPAVRPIVMSPEKLPFPNTFLFDNVFPTSQISNIYKRYCSDELNPRSVIIDIKDVQSTFTCAGKVPGAHYSDPELDCTVYHVCVEVSEKSLADTQFQCPLGTAFNQELLQCVSLGTFDCSKVSQYFAGEEELQTRSEKHLKKIPTLNFAVDQLCKVLKQQLPR